MKIRSTKNEKKVVVSYEAIAYKLSECTRQPNKSYLEINITNFDG